MNEFVTQNSFKDAWKKFQIDYTHVLETSGRTYTSTLDRFFWSEKITGCVKEADVLHLLSNTSDHCPVYCKLDVGGVGVGLTDFRTDSTCTQRDHDGDGPEEDGGHQGILITYA